LGDFGGEETLNDKKQKANRANKKSVFSEQGSTRSGRNLSAICLLANK